MHLFRIFLLFVLVGFFSKVHAQQDVDFQVNSHFLAGKKIIKVYKNELSPIIWVLADNNQVYKLNSSTGLINDLSAQFSAYGNLKFIDIACLNDQKLFIATNSTEVLMMFNGTVSRIGAVNGLIGTINSIGLKSNTSYFRGSNPNNNLFIATDRGFGNYNIDQNTLDFFVSTNPARIYEVNYRGIMYDVGDTRPSYNTQLLPVTVVGTVGIPTFYIRKDGLYGTPNTAIYTHENLKLEGSSNFYMYAYWGSENGLFANKIYNSQSDDLIKHFLSNIKVNKVNNILGLTSFGEQYYKNNLLIGTQVGLYFSASTSRSLTTPDLYLTHLDALGNISINDIRTDIRRISQTNPLINCEEGAWLGTDDGLYYIKADYGAYWDPQQELSAIQFKNYPQTTSELEVCSGTEVRGVVNYTFATNNIQWYKDGAQLPAESNNELIITQTGVYYAVLYDPCSNIHVETNHLKVSITSAPVFTFNYLDVIENCAGTATALKIEADNPAYQYRWYKDGVLNGNISATQNVTQNGIYRAEISACNGTWVTTKEVQVKFTDLQQPAITASKTSYCAGEQAQLITNVPVSNAYTINWYRNGTIISSNTNQTTLLTDVAATYTVSANNNNISCSKTSLDYTLIFNAIPTLSIEKQTNTAFCDGETIDLKATFNTGNITWSTGAATPSIQVKNTGTYTATVSTIAGCTITKDINVTLFPKPKLNMPDATLCEFINEQITLTAPTGFSSYMWNGQLGGRSYVVKSLGTVSLVVTDQNNCTASETINITSHCNAINMPNTITPNGDGVNDTWEISGINNESKTTVTIFNRLGTVVFTSRGYPTPWNGEYQGRKLPMGTYYYIISTSGNKQILSGSITIIY